MNVSAMLSAQMPRTSWHDGGLFMGMHWLWWGFWIVLLLVLVAAFWRVLADRAGTRRSAADEGRVEEALRHRFAKGEISEEEYLRQLKILREGLMDP